MAGKVLIGFGCTEYFIRLEVIRIPIAFLFAPLFVRMRMNICELTTVQRLTHGISLLQSHEKIQVQRMLINSKSQFLRQNLQNSNAI